MPTSQEIYASPNELGPESGAYDKAVGSMDVKIMVEQKNRYPKKRNVASKAGAMEVDESTKAYAEPKKKKRKRKKSILEKLDFNGGDESAVSVDGTIDNDAMEGKENSKMAASKANNTSMSNKKEPKKKTMRDFYSLSPKQDAESRPVSTDESTSKVTLKKNTRRKTARFVAINDEAKPIHVHIPFFGQDKNSSVTIESHCVENKFDLGEEPLVLTGKYDRRSKVHIQRFLQGFGRYIH